MIKNIIFDFGGVLGKSSSKVVLKELINAYKVNKRKLKEDLEHIESEYSDKKFSELEIKKLSKTYNIPISKIKKSYSKTPIFKTSFEYLKKLKEKGFNLYLFSDQIDLKTKSIKKNLDLSLFNKTIFSSDIKSNKKNIKSFNIFLEKTKLKPKECIFIDDNINNIKNGTKLGIKGIKYNSLKELKKKLIKLCSTK